MHSYGQLSVGNCQLTVPLPSWFQGMLNMYMIAMPGCCAARYQHSVQFFQQQVYVLLVLVAA